MSTEELIPPIMLSDNARDWSPLIMNWLNIGVMEGGSQVDWDWSQDYEHYSDYIYFVDHKGADECGHKDLCTRCMLTFDAENLAVYAVTEVNCSCHDTGCPVWNEQIKVEGESLVLYELHALAEYLNSLLRQTGLDQRIVSKGFTRVGAGA